MRLLAADVGQWEDWLELLTAPWLARGIMETTELLNALNLLSHKKKP